MYTNEFFNYTLGTQDPSMFDIPAYCNHGNEPTLKFFVSTEFDVDRISLAVYICQEMFVRKTIKLYYIHFISVRPRLKTG